jgi:hypothetical protein
MLSNQLIEIKWNQEISGNFEDLGGWQKDLSKSTALSMALLYQVSFT